MLRSRRQPRQRRARHTVEIILDAVARVLRKHGVGGVTTNRIAAAAGVSIGTVYQYFPDKRAIYLALHERHVAEIRALIERVLVEEADASLESFVKALFEALVDAHGADPELHALMASAVPHGGEGARELEICLRGTFKLAIAARGKRAGARPVERMLFVLPHLVETLAHGAAYRRPPGLSLAAAKDEGVRVLLGYLSPP